MIFFNPATEEFKTVRDRFGEDCILNKKSASHYADNFKNDESGRIYYEIYQSWLQRARELLELEPQLTIKEISYQVGFLKASYFSKLFMERFGKRPSAFLK